jgi:hypothetical protein
LIIVKTLGTKNKEKILKAPRKTHQATYEGKITRITTDFSTETLKGLGVWLKW